MKRKNNDLYEQIMRNVSKEIKRALYETSQSEGDIEDESQEITPEYVSKLIWRGKPIQDRKVISYLLSYYKYVCSALADSYPGNLLSDVNIYVKFLKAKIKKFETPSASEIKKLKLENIYKNDQDVAAFIVTAYKKCAFIRNLYKLFFSINNITNVRNFYGEFMKYFLLYYSISNIATFSNLEKDVHKFNKLKKEYYKSNKEVQEEIKEKYGSIENFNKAYKLMLAKHPSTLIGILIEGNRMN